MIEKRRFFRLQAPIGVHYQIVKKNKKPVSAPTLLRNISGGGVRLLTKGELRGGDVIDVKIQVPLVKQPIRSKAEVVWSHAMEAGVRFVDIRPGDLKEILEYVHHVGIGS